MSVVGQKRRRRAFKSFVPRIRFRNNWRTGGFLGIELKFLDTAWNGVTINTSTDGAGLELQPSTPASINCISVPAQGDGENERDGRKYTLKSAWVSGVVNFTADSSTHNAELTACFFAMVLDTQANGATINSEDVYINPGTNGQALIPQPLRNLQNSKRFKILATQQVSPAGNTLQGVIENVGGVGVTADTVPSQQMPVSLNWKGNLVCDSIGTTATVSSASDNAIHVIACCGTTSYSPQFIGKGRVRFVG